MVIWHLECRFAGLTPGLLVRSHSARIVCSGTRVLILAG